MLQNLLQALPEGGKTATLGQASLYALIGFAVVFMGIAFLILVVWLVGKILNNKNCLLMLSNSDPKNTNKEDNFFDDIYDGFEIKRVFAKRMINCQASKRGDITEIVVMNYKRRK